MSSLRHSKGFRSRAIRVLHAPYAPPHPMAARASRLTRGRERRLMRMGWSRLAQHFAAASPPRPVLPGALGLGRIGLVARVAGVDLAKRQRLHLAEREGGQQGP